MKLLLVSLLLSSPAFAAEHVITMKSISFEPKAITINAGDTVKWENKSYTDHSATADDGKGFDTGDVNPKKTSKPITFTIPGSIGYHCRVHGKTMSGTITVKAF